MQKKCENLFAYYGKIIHDKNPLCIAFFQSLIAIFKMVSHDYVQCTVSIL